MLDAARNDGLSLTAALERLLEIEVEATEARRLAGRNTCMRFFAGPKLLVIDELGYLPLPGDGASALFQVINQRYLKSSTILPNVGIADWAGAFGTPPSPRPCSTGCCTAPPSASTDPPTGTGPPADRRHAARRRWYRVAPGGSHAS